MHNQHRVPHSHAHTVRPTDRPPSPPQGHSEQPSSLALLGKRNIKKGLQWPPPTKRALGLFFFFFLLKKPRAFAYIYNTCSPFSIYSPFLLSYPICIFIYIYIQFYFEKEKEFFFFWILYKYVYIYIILYSYFHLYFATILCFYRLPQVRCTHIVAYSGIILEAPVSSFSIYEFH